MADRVPLSVPEARRQGDSAPLLALSLLVAAMGLVGLSREVVAPSTTKAPLAPLESPGAIALREGRGLDVNEATPEDLELLPRVGPAIAARIVAARPFTSVEDLQRVRGIGPRTVERLRPLIVVHNPGDETGTTLAPAAMDGYQGESPGTR